MHVYDQERNKIINASKQMKELERNIREEIEELRKNCNHDVIIESPLPETLKQNGMTKIKICFICGTIFT